MSPEDQLIVEIIEALLSQIRQQTRAISSEEALVRARQCAVEAMADIDETLNAHRPLLSIPTELLQKIMAYICDDIASQRKMSWPIRHVGVHDPTMLLPISQTCRRLRNVSLGFPALWTSVARGPLPISRLLVQRSRDLPLHAFVYTETPLWSFRQGSTSNNNLDAADVARELASRIQVLYIDYSSSNDSTLQALFSAFLPILESLSLSFSASMHYSDGSYGYPVDLKKERVPRLRRLTLRNCDIMSLDVLSSLTHLEIHRFVVRRTHERIATILSNCHTLESLHLQTVDDFDHRQNGSPPANHHYPPPSPSSVCRHLRRVTLAQVHGHLASLVLSFVSAEQPHVAVQLHNLWQVLNPPLSHYSLLNGIETVVIGRYPQFELYQSSYQDYSYIWGVTAASPQRSTLRWTERNCHKAINMLREQGSAALSSVRELWLADVSPATACGEGSTLPVQQADVLRTLIGDLPALETVVLVNQFQAPWSRVPPSLALLPDAVREPASGVMPPRPKTLRIAYGYGPHVNARLKRPKPLDLACILEELASGAYGYLEHLLIETPFHVDVDGQDVERLRAHFETVQVRRVDRTPTVALPAYYAEPTDGQDGKPWPYRLW